MGAAFVKAAETIGAECLENANVNVGVIVLEEDVAVDVDVFRDAVEIVIEELLAEFGRKVGFRIEEERGEIVLQSALAAALVIEEIRLAMAEHDVAGLKVAVEEKIAIGAEKKFGEAFEIVFERLFVEWNAGEAKEIVFEIAEVPDDGLAVEAGAGITDGVVEIAAGFNLEFRKGFDNFAINVDDGRRDDGGVAMLRQKFKEGGVAEIFFKISALIERVAVDFRNGKAVTAEVAREFEEGEIFFANIVEDADGGGVGSGEADDLAAGAAEFALKRKDTLGGFAEVLFEKAF
jgi:hypothetical protein